MLREILLYFTAMILLTQSVFGVNVTLERVKRGNDECGVPSQGTSLIIRGNDFQRGAWPWMVALMVKSSSPPKLFCGGVLVSATKVLTGKRVRNMNVK